ncbi:ExeM/NucH family extracellular endonuclease [Pseudidiomarina sp. 1APR75-33.1]|uniref:ExeM/NucH family extracellular endonuclease n=1 Tax=Pseudidiomarina terrestris TaxID=2820060 RepID=UPI00264B7E12|nr:ExeM/NucH family extracellular endonuclease [Pseudidiomarina sp. 1APR75-33.1]MDN7126064.1 ExeM/NucH family extracellular endonuclease [Pseudidiomarina sp. 1APR75-33.1]
MKRHNLALAVSALLVSSAASADIIISEHIEGSSNNKAIEFFNAGATEIDLSTYVLEIYSNGGTEAGNTVPLVGTLPPNGIYVVAHPSASAEIQAIADKTGNLFYNGNDALVLRSGDAVVDSMGQIGVDEVWESDGVSMQNQTIRRKDSITSGDTDPSDVYAPGDEFNSFAIDDISDLGQHLGFGSAQPEPEPEPAPEFGACGDAATLVSEVQGSGLSSPLFESEVVVEAVVTAVYLDGERPLNGFFIQEEDADQDTDPATSEGVFVYHQDTAVAAGDKVRLAGTVGEYYDSTQISGLTAITVCASGESVTPASFSVPVDSLNAFEAIEGMLVQLEHPVVVTDTETLGQYGEFWVARDRLYTPTQVAAPAEDNTINFRLNAFLVDDARGVTNAEDVPFPAGGLSAVNTLRLGTEITNPVGVINYSFSEYRLLPTSALQYIDANPRTEAPQLTDEGDLRIASFNVQNFFNGDGAGGGFPTERGAGTLVEYERQLAKLVAAITAMNADIIGLNEIENDGFAETSAIAQLVAEVNAQSDAEWAFVSFGDAEYVGSDAITNALIYRTDRAAETGTAVFTTEVPFDFGNRPPIAQTFHDLVNEDEVTVVVNHFRSKGGCNSSAAEGDKDSGDGQGCWNATRVQAAEKVLEWIANDPTGRDVEDVILVGDFNAYGMEDPVQAIIDAGYTDLQFAALGAENHTYVYDGLSGSLDHAFASTSLNDKVVATVNWNINADEPQVFSYNTEYKSEVNLANYYNEDPYRSSDHDPVVVAMTTEANDSGDNDGGDADVDDGNSAPPVEEMPNIDHATTSGSFPVWMGLSLLLLGLLRRRV